MKIKPQYGLHYDLDGIFIAEKTPDGIREICTISDTAAMAWEGLERGMAIPALAKAVMEEFEGATQEQVEQDITALAQQLIALGYAEE